MKIIFYTAAGFIFYTYVGYPLLLILLAKVFPRPVERKVCLPFVSVVIAVCNEETTIERRLNNLLSQDYPADLFQIVVISDGSQDNTNNIVKSFVNNRINFISYNERQGKSVALNHGVARADGEIIVFADARQLFAPDSLSLLVRNFSEEIIGCASGELLFSEDDSRGQFVEMGVYWRYEKIIRNLESASGSVVGATGAIYAIRKSLFVPLPPNTILDDVLTPLNVAGQGYRVVFDSAPKAYDKISKSLDLEWSRKVRTLTGNLQLLAFAPHILIPWRSPLWWRFLSHKIFRLIIPFVLICLLITNFWCQGYFYRSALYVQLLFYISALVGYLIPPLRKVRLINFFIFFIVMNFAALVGIWLWASGRCASVWRPIHVK